MSNNILLFFLPFLLFLVACDEKPETCEAQSARKLHIGFYSSPHGKVAASDSAVAKVVAIHNAFKDTVTVTKSTRINLPLSQLCDSSVFDITINQKTTTLYVYYNRKLIFENYKCGFRYDFELKSIVSKPQFCDSIKIIQSYVSDVAQENCRFYFNPDATKY